MCMHMYTPPTSTHIYAPPTRTTHPHSIVGPTAYDALASFEARWWRQVGLSTTLHHQRTRRLVDIRRLHNFWLPPPSMMQPVPPASAAPHHVDNTPDTGTTTTTAPPQHAPPRMRFSMRLLSRALSFQHPTLANGDHPPHLDATHDAIHPSAWTVQLFRSVDNHASAGLPRRNADAVRLGLHTVKSRVYDSSIQEAYVWAIRSAQRFLYIENQYFVGSSHAWPKVCVVVGGGWWMCVHGWCVFGTCKILYMLMCETCTTQPLTL